MKVCHFREDFSNAFVTKRQTDRLRREAFGVRRIPALCESSARREAKAPEYGALQTLRAIWLRLGRTVDPARRDAYHGNRPARRAPALREREGFVPRRAGALRSTPP